MRLLSLATFAFAANISVTSAYELDQHRDSEGRTNRTGGFNLMILSSNSTFNGSLLDLCHELPLYQSLCPSSRRSYAEGFAPPPPKPYQKRFFLDQSASNERESWRKDQSNSDLTHGNLLWAYDHLPAILRMGLHGGSCTNVHLALFGTTEQIVTFDKDGMLYIRSQKDENITPTGSWTFEPKVYNNWYICKTQYNYLQETVNWVSGGEPINPSCQKIEIKRVPEVQSQT
ncbi:hypothetical protein VTL71DRAFT_9380 [Oculimacula yallundae]|uniref:Uncharacterized protein n=1 Tax=Oculimacula yallundae TaxID=86028 RepID=A0ABR4BUK4_9HELO